ncbi:SH3 domain-containing protein [Ruminococcaceae bacterium YRB3002]|nr:SH3 domain-containing protein [Ruminococcaceae bacterium YRB3002]
MRRADKFMIVSVALVSSILIACAGCGKKPVETSASSTTTTTTIATITTTTTTAATLPVYSGPLETSETVEMTWTETTVANGEVTLYAHVSAGNFLRIRRGPGTNYDIAGTLTRGQSVVVVASTNNGWYKTQDGFYVSGEYVKASQPT